MRSARPELVRFRKVKHSDKDSQLLNKTGDVFKNKLNHSIAFRTQTRGWFLTGIIIQGGGGVRPLTTL